MSTFIPDEFEFGFNSFGFDQDEVPPGPNPDPDPNDEIIVTGGRLEPINDYSDWYWAFNNDTNIYDMILVQTMVGGGTRVTTFSVENVESIEPIDADDDGEPDAHILTPATPDGTRTSVDTLIFEPPNSDYEMF